MEKGVISRVSGPLVVIKGLNPKMYNVIQIGEEKLIGEVVGIEGKKCMVQVYEDTYGIKPGEPAWDTGKPLSVELGPGLIGNIYDGIQRPLPEIREEIGDFVRRGVMAPGLDRTTKWHFVPLSKRGDKVSGGTIIGEVREGSVNHKILVPPGEKPGVITEIEEGEYKVEEPVCLLEDGREITMYHVWPVRRPRPFLERLSPEVPLITGQRILDFLFPVAKGGTAAIPGGFGTGKTVTQQTLAKWCDAEVVIYVGCGERGNEMADVLEEFPKLEDPRTGRPLMERTVLIANTSNMPVAAREASVYTGMTIAEYFRDMGYSVALMADSTSRWAEAMREISSRLEEMPGEEGYPAYLGARLAEFYERAGRVRTLSGDEGSVTVIGAVSPPGGDMSEPVTQNTLRIVKVFWALDYNLAYRRHFPAINWLKSYSLYEDTLRKWFEDRFGEDWTNLRKWTKHVLQQEAELREIVQLVGPEALPPDQRVLLEVARLIRLAFLQQNAFHPVDTYYPPEKQIEYIRAIKRYEEMAYEALRSGVPVERILSVKGKEKLIRVKYEENFVEELRKIIGEMTEEFESLIEEWKYKVE
ncbi:V-type ATP synthase subunit A [Thermococci archaeon]|nr:MAG: V-type ATP synthase subunit A [Thermococci archaeon]RLF95827.1 MAG: V-type ATP synthase subunit A [Thermococci archaeon]